MQAGNAVAGSAEAGHRAVRADRQARSQERRGPSAARPFVPPQQRAAEIGERVQDRGRHPARFGRSRHHAGVSLQRRRRFRSRSAGAERHPRYRSHCQAVLRPRLHLRAAEGLQAGGRRLSQVHRDGPRQSRRRSRPGAKPDERWPDRRRARAVQGDRRCRSFGCADLHAHCRDRSPQRQVRPGDGGAEEGRFRRS